MGISKLRALALLVPLAFSSCVEAPTVLRADVSWRLSCSGTIVGGSCPALTISGMAWDFIQFEGEVATDETSGANLGILRADCTAYDVGTHYLLDLRAAVPGSGAGEGDISVQSLRLSKADLTYVDGGYVDFTAGPNTYGGSNTGLVSSAAPTQAVPCQLTQFAVNTQAAEGVDVDLRLLCDGVPNSAQPSSKVSIRDAGAPAQPALLHFTGCEGFPRR